MMDDESSMAPEVFFNCSRKAYDGKQMNKRVYFAKTWLDSMLYSDCLGSISCRMWGHFCQLMYISVNAQQGTSAKI
jgi:hypothetical protein